MQNKYSLHSLLSLQLETEETLKCCRVCCHLANKFNIVSNDHGYMQKCNFLEYQFWANLVQKIKIVSLNWNLEPSLSQICRIQLWCELFLFWTRNTLFGKIWSQNSKLFQVKFGTETDLNMQNSLNAVSACRICIFAFFVFVCKSPFWLREHWQKTFVTHSGFWPLRGWGGGGLSESVKKGKFLTKISFSVNVEWSSKKLWKMILADVKANKNKK